MSYFGNISQSTFAGLANTASALGVNESLVRNLVDGRDVSGLLAAMHSEMGLLTERPEDPAAAALLDYFKGDHSHSNAIVPNALLEAFSGLTTVQTGVARLREAGGLFSEDRFQQRTLPEGLKLLDSILITNRGDPAIRAIRAIRAFNQLYGLNIKVGVIHSAVDKQDKFVGMADFAVEIPTAKKTEAFILSLKEKLEKLSNDNFEAEKASLIAEIMAAKSHDIYFFETYETIAIQLVQAKTLTEALEDISKAIPKMQHPVTSYNNVEGILAEIQKRQKAGEKVGVFPGWGFLSERHDFVKALEDAGVAFMGPTSEQMEAMGHKRNCLVNMDGFGVPVGTYTEKIRDIAHGVELADKMGYPCMLKYSLGGGGTGNIMLDSEDDAAKQLKIFFDAGKSDLFIENFIGGEDIEVVHLEFQVVGDGEDVIVLEERECSAQRKNQKVFEGTASRIPISKRREIAEALRAALKAKRWVGASTAEFLVAIKKDKDGRERYTAKFMEVNTRVQVEHGTTEMAHGFDILHQLLLIAMGGKLTKRQTEVKKRSVTLEARILAENRQFQSQAGTIKKCVFPEGPWVRVDSAVHVGSQVSPYFDSMIAKLIVEAPMRDYDVDDPEDMKRAEDEAYAVAVARMQSALDETHIVGIETNLELLRELSRTPEFVENKLNLSVVKKYVEAHPEPVRPYMDLAVATAVTKAYLHEHKQVRQLFWSREVAKTDDFIPQPEGRNFTVYDGQKPLKVRAAEVAKGRMKLDLQDRSIFFDFEQIDDYTYRIHLPDGQHVEVYLNQTESLVALELKGVNYNFTVTPGDVVKDRNLLESPMSANVFKVYVKEGEFVEAGKPICMLDSMKQYTDVLAHQSGIVEKVFIKLAQAVGKGTPLAQITPPPSENEVKIEPLTLDLKSFSPQDLLERLKLAGAESNNAEQEIIEEIVKVPYLYFPKILAELKNYFLGYDYPKSYINYLMITVERMLEVYGGVDETGALGEILGKEVAVILNIAADLRAFFQDEYANDLYALRESNLSGNIVLSPKFDKIVGNILKHFGVPVSSLKEIPITSRSAVHNALFRIFLSSREKDFRNDLLGRFVKIAKNFDNETTQSLKSLVEVCGSFDPIKKAALDVLSQSSPETYRLFVPAPVATHYLPEYDAITRDSLAGLNDQTVRSSFWRSLLSEANDTSRDTLPPPVLRFLEQFERQQNMQARLLASPIDGVFTFALRAKDTGLLVGDAPSLIGFTSITVLPETGNVAVGASYERALIEASRATGIANQIYHSMSGATRLRSNSVFVLSSPSTETATPLLLDDEWSQIGKNVKGFLQKGDVRSAYIACAPIVDGKEPSAVYRYDLSGDKTIRTRKISSDVVLKPEDSKTLLQHDRGLMTVEERMEAFFGSGNYRELTVRTAEGIQWPDKKTGKLKPCPVGVRIVEGFVDGKKVYAYFGDFRVFGGAFGIMEGIQQVYLFLRAYLDEGTPIIGFMDSAGANIFQDSLSLSFSAEDFLMKVLTGSEADRELFLRTIVHHPDRQLFDNLINEVLQDLSPNKESTKTKLQENRAFQDFVSKYAAPILALPLQIGAGIGMVIYGSALLPVELMLELFQSYRNLTGERVRNVAIGEKLANSESGGAQVHALKSSQAHDVFYSEEEGYDIAKALLWLFHPSNRRSSEGSIPPMPEEWANGNLSIRRLFEKLDRRVFWPFMHDLEQGQALLSGFGKLGGIPVAILEAASETGFGTYAAIHKARKVYEAARSLKAPVIKIIGKRWIDTERSSDARAINERAKLEIESIQDPIPQFSIVTDLGGIRALGAHSTSDVKFFVRNDSNTEREISRIMQAGYMIVGSVEEAMDFIRKILPYYEKDHESRPLVAEIPLDSPLHPLNSSSDKLKSLIPDDVNQGYDVRAVINEVVDAESFQEIWKDVPGDIDNHSRLIVGFARSGGIPVIVISDDKNINGGAATAIGAEKFEKAVALAEKMGLQVVCLNDAPGFHPGADQEERDVQGSGADSIKRNIRFTRGAVTVTYRGYGGRWIQALNKFLNSVTYGIALEGSEIAVMGPEGAIAALDEEVREMREWSDQPGLSDVEAAARREAFMSLVKKKAAEKRAKGHGNPQQAYLSGAIDVISAKVDLRKQVYLGLLQAQILAETAHRRDFNTMTSQQLVTAKVVAMLEETGLKTRVVGQVRRPDTIQVVDRLDEDVRPYKYLKAREKSDRDGFTGEYDIGFMNQVLSAYGSSAVSAEGLVALLDAFTGQISDEELVAVAQARGALTTFLSAVDEALVIHRDGAVELSGNTLEPETFADTVRSFAGELKQPTIETLVRNARLFDKPPTRNIASA